MSFELEGLEVAVWYPDWETREQTWEMVELLRPHRLAVRHFLLRRAGPAAALRLASAIGDGCGDPPMPEDSTWSDDFAGVLQLQERDLELALGLESKGTCEDQDAEVGIRD